MLNGKTIAALCAASLLASPAFGQAPTQPATPPAITSEALDAAKALSAYQRGQAMTANAAKRLCDLGQRDYCQAPAQANAPNSSTNTRR